MCSLITPTIPPLKNIIVRQNIAPIMYCHISTKAGFDPVYGARPLRRAIQSKIEDELSELMLEGKVDSEHGVTCDYRDDAFVFDVK